MWCNLNHIKKMKKTLILSAMMVSIHMATQAQPVLQAQRTYGGGQIDQANAVIQTSDGGFLMVGRSNSAGGNRTNPLGGADVWLVKTNANQAIQWQRSFGGSGTDIGYDVKATTDGGYIVAGSTNSTNGDVVSPRGGNDAFLLKVDASGNKQWWVNCGGSLDDEARSVWQNTDGSYSFAGNSRSSSPTLTNRGVRDALAGRVNATGAVVWLRSYGGTQDDAATGIQQISQGDIVLSGVSSSNNFDVSNRRGGSDAWVLRLNNTNGNIVWSRLFGGIEDDRAATLRQIAGGDIVVVGSSESINRDVTQNRGFEDFWAFRITNGGTLVWSTTYGGPQADDPFAMAITPDGGILMSGESRSASQQVPQNRGGDDFLTIKINAAGVFQWAITSGGNRDDSAAGLAVTSDGGFVVAGYTESRNNGDVTTNRGEKDYWLVKYSSSANRLRDNELVPEMQSFSFIAYPNPVVDQFQIQSETEIALVRVFNVNGQLQTEQIVNNLNHWMDFSAYGKGMYIVEALSADGQVMRKTIVKQ